MRPPDALLLAVVRAGRAAHTTAGLTSALRALLELLAEDWLEEAETDDE